MLIFKVEEEVAQVTATTRREAGDAGRQLAVNDVGALGGKWGEEADEVYITHL